MHDKLHLTISIMDRSRSSDRDGQKAKDRPGAPSLLSLVWHKITLRTGKSSVPLHHHYYFLYRFAIVYEDYEHLHCKSGMSSSDDVGVDGYAVLRGCGRYCGYDFDGSCLNSWARNKRKMTSSWTNLSFSFFLTICLALRHVVVVVADHVDLPEFQALQFGFARTRFRL